MDLHLQKKRQGGLIGVCGRIGDVTLTPKLITCADCKALYALGFKSLGQTNAS